MFFRLGFVWIEHDCADVVLVHGDSLSITLAESSKQVQESFVFKLTNTKTDQASYCRFFDLGVKKLFIVFEQLRYRFFGKKAVGFIGDHSLFEKKIDPLSYIVFVDVVVLHRVQQDSVDELTDTSDRMLLGQVGVLVKTRLEGKYQTIN